MLSRNFNYLLVNLTRQIRSFVKNKTKDSPMTFEQIRAISYIARFEGLSQKQLATLLESKTMATSKLVEGLESLQLINRLNNETDKRSYQLYLTEAGKIEMVNIWQLSKLTFESISKNISPDEILSCYRTLEKIQKNVQSLDFSEGKDMGSNCFR